MIEPATTRLPVQYLTITLSNQTIISHFEAIIYLRLHQLAANKISKLPQPAANIILKIAAAGCEYNFKIAAAGCE